MHRSCFCIQTLDLSDYEPCLLISGRANASMFKNGLKLSKIASKTKGKCKKVNMSQKYVFCKFLFYYGPVFNNTLYIFSVLLTFVLLTKLVFTCEILTVEVFLFVCAFTD